MSPRNLWTALRHEPLTAPLALIALVLFPVLAFGITHPAGPLPVAKLGFAVSPSGDDVGRLTPVRVHYELPPADRDGSRLVRLEPQVKGEYAWLDDRTLLFQPEYPGYRRGERYEIHVAAAPEAGLAESRVDNFTSTGALKVVQVIPEDREQGVVADTPILVQFSRGVAALTTLTEMARAQPVLIFDPPLEGRGEWVSTGLYRFTPRTLPPNAKYSVRLQPGLSAESDGQLAAPFSWSFETYGPGVNKITPDPGGRFGSLRQRVTIEFNLPMDRQSVQRAFTLKASSGGNAEGVFAWENNDQTVSFTPTGLQSETSYTAEIAAGAAARVGGTLTRAVQTSFTTVGPVRVEQMNPRDGSELSYPLYVSYNNPMDIDSFEGLVTISEIPANQIRLYGGGDRNFYISSNQRLQASRSYTVRIAAGGKDRYGQPAPPVQWTFTTPPISPRVSFIIPGSVGQYSSAVTQDLYFSAINTPEVTFNLYTLSSAKYFELMQLNYIPGQFNFGVGAPLRTWRETVRPERDLEHFKLTTLGANGPLPTGFYFITATIPGSSSLIRPEFVFSVADTALVTKASQDGLVVWALDMETGQPLRGLPVRLVDGPGSTQMTNGDGLATLPLTKRVDYRTDRNYIVEVNAGGHYGVTSLRWQSFPNVAREPYARDYVAHLYTDRVIFRPGETVELKGVVRTDEDAAYRVPSASESWQMVIRGPGFDVLSQQAVKVNDFGTFTMSYPVPSGARLGDYRLSLEYAGLNNRIIASASFAVIEFRKPEFEVALRAPTSLTSGDTLPVQALATYLFGGGVPGAPMRWQVTASPYIPRLSGTFQGYSFVDADPYKPSTIASGPRASGNGVTDATGQFAFNVPTELSAGSTPQTFAVSATVTDTSAQALASTTSVIVFPADVVPGLRPDRYIASMNTPARISLVTLRPDQTRMPRRAVNVRVYERTWVTTKELGTDGGRYYSSKPVDTLVTTIPATTDERGEASVSVTPRTTGSLRIVVEATDDRGRTALAGTPLYVYGSSNATWRYSNDERFELVADKTAYRVGDTAEILVPAPYPGAIGLVTIERGKNIRQTVMRFDSNTAIVTVPIGNESVPNIFVSVVLYRAPSATDPAPRFNVGTIDLPVSTETRNLSVAIRADRDRATPRDRVRYDVKVTDSTGAGVSAEVSMAVVDKAVLLLAEDRGPTGLLAFWFQRGLGVDTGSSFMVLVNRLNDTLRGLLGDGTSKGGDGFAAGDPRREFKNTAFWQGQVRTNDRGEASVEVALPDNVTTWRMQMRAVTPDARVGESVHELLTTAALIARPALPRFTRVGDRISARVLVQNGTAAATDATVSVLATGATMTDTQPRRVRIEPGRAAIVEWPATALPGERVVFTFSAEAANGSKDSVETSLPVYAAYTPETTATGGTVVNEAMPEALYLPPGAILADGSLTLAVRQTLAATLSLELSRFPRLPYEESTDYLIGRLRTRLALAELTQDQSHTPAIQEGISSVLSRSAGAGWVACGLCSYVDPELTARALIALGDAQAQGFSVTQDRLDAGHLYLRGLLDQRRDVESPLDPNTRAKYLYAIVHSGGAAQMSGPIRTAWDDDRAKLSTSGRAYLFMAMDDARIRDSAYTSARSAIIASAIRSGTAAHWEEELPNGRSGYTVLATSLAIEALNRSTPTPTGVREAQNWLALARLDAPYESSWETGQYARAIGATAARGGGKARANGYSVLLNGTSVMSGTLDPAKNLNRDSKSVPLTALVPGKVNLLMFSRSGLPNEQILYSAFFRYQMPASDAEAVNRGFAVAREVSTVESPGTRIHEATLGATVRVKITVAISAEARDVNVVDLLPAGLEAIDPKLRTSDRETVTRLQTEQRLLNQASSTYSAPWMRWYYSPWDSNQLRDDRIEVHARQLPRGVHEFVYFARATTVGTFLAPPPIAVVAGLPDVFGRGDSETFVVRP